VAAYGLNFWNQGFFFLGIDEMDIYRQTLDMEELGQLYQLTKTISS
jgi:hypothetical protein